ncbi:MAG: hypothetical protein WCI18_05350 [Pseudomonadota bacterium]
MFQVDRQVFISALIEIGHDPLQYEDLTISTNEAALFFNIDMEFFEYALEDGFINQTSDGEVSLLDAAWIHYCFKCDSEISQKLSVLS